MRYASSDIRLKSRRVDVRAAAKKALSRLFEPLTRFAIDVGMSTRELQEMLREEAVRSAAASQRKALRRINVSGIAATTGLPRGEVSRILRSRATSYTRRLQRQTGSTRILAAWRKVSKFQDDTGRPADLKVYGRGATFESLARSYGGGIPTRAIVDELISAGAVEILPSQTLRMRSLFILERGINPVAIKAFGERASSLLTTMLFNMTSPQDERFIGSVLGSAGDLGSLQAIRKDISRKSADFLGGIQRSFRLPGVGKGRGVKGSTTIEVTVFCHESFSESPKPDTQSKRKNLRRN